MSFLCQASGTLGSAVTSEFGLPCSVLNDVHAHALGEARHGAGHGKDSVLTVAVGTGIAALFRTTAS